MQLPEGVRRVECLELVEGLFLDVYFVRTEGFTQKNQMIPEKTC